MAGTGASAGKAGSLAKAALCKIATDGAAICAAIRSETTKENAAASAATALLACVMLPDNIGALAHNSGLNLRV